MFLHIGNNVLLRKSEIIGIFSIDALINDAKGKKFLADVRQSRNVEDISEGKWTSLVLTDDRVYISRISTQTLLARSGANLKDIAAGREAVEIDEAAGSVVVDKELENEPVVEEDPVFDESDNSQETDII